MSDANPWLQPVTLYGTGVRLEPLDRRHCGELIDAVKDGELWRLWYTSVPAPERMQAEIDRLTSELAASKTNGIVE